MFDLDAILKKARDTMWPFKKKKKEDIQFVPPSELLFSQVDITERFGDHLSLGVDDWIETVPLNATDPDPTTQGLPPVGASEEEVYRVAEGLSRLRESTPIPSDGVYCPICHIANVSLSRLRTPCPKCGRELLKFGWD